MSFIAGSAVTLWLAAAVVTTSYALAVRFSGECRMSLRWAGAAIVGTWLLVTVFFGLAAAGLFSIVPALTAWSLLAAAVVRRRTLRLFAEDIEHLVRCAKQVGVSPLLAVLLAAGGMAGLRFARGLYAPPLGWDALTYHLVKAGHWVQSGGLTLGSAPDAWSYYKYFAPAGDILWAWAMLPVRSDALLAPAGLVVWLTVMLGTYATSVALGAGRRAALVTALAVGTLPAVLSFLTAAYVDNTTLALVLLGSCLVLRGMRSGRAADLLLALAALSLSAATHHIKLPVALLGMGVVLLIGLRHRLDGARVAALALLALAPLAIVYLWAWKDTGSPLYPLTLRIGGVTLLEGNAQLAALLDGSAFPGLVPRGAADFLTLLFGRRYLPGWQHVNLGPAPLLLAVVGIVGAVLLLGRRERRTGALFLLAVAAASIMFLFLELGTTQKSVWAMVVGRFLTVAAAMVAILGAVVPGRLAAALRLLAAPLSLWFGRPGGLGPLDWPALAELGLFAAGAVLCLILVWLLGARLGRSRRALAAGLLAAVLVLAAKAASLRAALRYPLYARAARGLDVAQPTYDLHPLLPDATAAWPVWAALDGDRPRRIAFVAGWDGVGHNWCRYPLLGRRLQNEVVYVPFTETGKVLSYSAPLSQLLRQASEEAWLGRLLRRGVDVVVLAPPATPEALWVTKHPQIFRVLARGATHRIRAYRVQRAALRRHLDGGPG